MKISNKINLRDYQINAIDKVKQSIEKGEKSGILYLATGLGKTIIATALSKELNKNTLFIVHREELAIQTLKKFLYVDPTAQPGIVQAKLNQTGRKITIASIQTLCSEKRLKQLLESTHYDLIIIDECHHFFSGKWKEIVEQIVKENENSYLVGLTATPNRADNIRGDSLFNKIIFRYNIIEGIKKGYLVDITGIRYNINVDMDSIEVQNGDYAVQSLSNLMRTPEVVMETYQAWETNARDKKTIVFCVSLDHVFVLEDYFKTKGIKVKSIIGDTDSDDRARIYNDFEKGNVQVLISCMVLCEGFDEPSVECVLHARPTVSESLYIQMTGRGLRLYPNKEKCLVIDLVGNSKKHRLMQLGILFGIDSYKKKKALLFAKEFGIESEENNDWENIESVFKLLWSKETLNLQNIEDQRLFEWVETEYGLVLSLDKKTGFLLIQKESGLNFNKIIHFYSQGWKDKQDILADGLSLTWAITIAEKEAIRFINNNTNLIDKNSVWRTRQPSQKQIDLITQNNYPIPKTMGEASKILNKIFTEQKILGFELAVNSESGKSLINNIQSLKDNNELYVKIGNKKLNKLSLNEANRIILFNKPNSD